jgi:CRP/FNR family transcriptional regulator
MSDVSLKVVGNHFLFLGLNPDEQRRLLGQMSEGRYDEGSFIFMEGEPAERLVLVISGRVKMVKHSPDGHETILAMFDAGQIVGEVGVLAGGEYPATAQAMEPTTTLSLARRTYVELVRSHSALAWALIEELGHRLQRAHETIRSLAVEKVEQRVARLLLRLAAASGKKENGSVLITIPLTRQEIADMAGTTVETAIRTMSKLRRLGLADDGDTGIRLLRPHQLVLFADGRPLTLDAGEERGARS